MIKVLSIITIDTETGPKLQGPVNYVSSRGTQVVIECSSESDNILSVQFKLKSDDSDQIKSRMDKELQDIVDQLAFEMEMKILDYRVTGSESLDEDGRQDVMIFAEPLRLTIGIVNPILINEQWADFSSRVLSKPINEDLSKVLKNWREAISKKSDTDRFILLYKILESKLGKGSEIDKWILAKDPSLKFKSSDNKDKASTILTHIRDCIAHPKESQFTLNEMPKFTAQLQVLAKVLIKEKYPEIK